MSGHSKWSTIKHKKASEDKKRADAFSKMARAIIICARNGGSDTETNYSLRSVVEKAKGINMPKEKIERAIKKGAGEIKGEKLEEMLIEAYGPQGAAILIEVVTDNKNRSISEIKNALSKNGCVLATSGSVKWLFKRQGVIKVKQDQVSSQEDFELLAIDLGAIEIEKDQGYIFVFVKKENLQKTQEELEKSGFICAGELAWVPKEGLSVNEKSEGIIKKIFELASERDDAQGIYTNAL